MLAIKMPTRKMSEYQVMLSVGENKFGKVIQMNEIPPLVFLSVTLTCSSIQV